MAPVTDIWLVSSVISITVNAMRKIKRHMPVCSSACTCGPVSWRESERTGRVLPNCPQRKLKQQCVTVSKLNLHEIFFFHV